MTKLELLEQSIYEEGLSVMQHDFGELPLKALWFDGTIVLSPQITGSTEKRCLLAEEYCHHKYSVGNVLLDSKQEAFARQKAYEYLVPMAGLAKVLQEGCSTLYECAEQLEVTEEVLAAALNYYHSKGILEGLDQDLAAESD